ncbi:MAG: hypothetical protein EZS28_018482 [Streblomastix strix]|uniref:Uncharacterized protein n=1 Tax=Streblomastix strix TaxID=222440 RepID=A0A5J4VTN6_9EUKA|nr:MAG: hypothetical protein EZS28_018482 [Streblomastix strix]
MHQDDMLEENEKQESITFGGNFVQAQPSASDLLAKTIDTLVAESIWEGKKISHAFTIEVEQVNADNQYITEACTINETIPYSMEEQIVGFNGSRFVMSLIVQYMQCKDWTISNYTGSSSTSKQQLCTIRN